MNRFQSLAISWWAWRGIFASISRPRVWVPFLIITALQAIILILVINFHQRPVLPVALPLVRLLAGDEVVHYPVFYYVMPTLFFRINMVINIFIASITGAVATTYFARAYGYGDDSGAWGRAFRAAPSLIGISIVTVTLLFGVAWLAAQVPNTAATQGVIGRWGLRLVSMLLFILVQSFLAYSTAWVALIGHKFWPAIRDSVRITSQTLLPTLIAVGVPALLLYPFTYAAGRVDIVINNLNPEVMVVILILQIICQIFVTVLLVGAVTRLFLWRVEAAQ